MKKLSVAILLAAMSFSAHALEVRPLATTFPAGHKSGEMTVSNTDVVEKTYQVFIAEISLVDGKQVRTPTKDVRFAPTIMTIAPKSDQTVRYVRSGGAVSGEKHYRIWVKEIPSEIGPTKTGINYSTWMNFAWIWRESDAAPQLSATSAGNAITITNSGTATAQLVNLVAGPKIKKGLLGYVLPGETATFTIDAPVGPTVKLMVNGKLVDLDVK